VTATSELLSKYQLKGFGESKFDDRWLLVRDKPGLKAETIRSGISRKANAAHHLCSALGCNREDARTTHPRQRDMLFRKWNTESGKFNPCRLRGERNFRFEPPRRVSFASSRSCLHRMHKPG
jgi:hypothetical protein